MEEALLAGVEALSLDPVFLDANPVEALEMGTRRRHWRGAEADQYDEPLPFVIGTQDFVNSDDVGLDVEDEEDEEEMAAAGGYATVAPAEGQDPAAASIAAGESPFGPDPSVVGGGYNAGPE